MCKIITRINEKHLNIDINSFELNSVSKGNQSKTFCDFVLYLKIKPYSCETEIKKLNSKLCSCVKKTIRNHKNRKSDKYQN